MKVPKMLSTLLILAIFAPSILSQKPALTSKQIEAIEAKVKPIFDACQKKAFSLDWECKQFEANVNCFKLANDRRKSLGGVEIANTHVTPHCCQGIKNPDPKVNEVLQVNGPYTKYGMNKMPSKEYSDKISLFFGALGQKFTTCHQAALKIQENNDKNGVKSCEHLRNFETCWNDAKFAYDWSKTVQITTRCMAYSYRHTLKLKDCPPLALHDDTKDYYGKVISKLYPAKEDQ